MFIIQACKPIGFSGAINQLTGSPVTGSVLASLTPIKGGKHLIISSDVNNNSSQGAP